MQFGVREHPGRYDSLDNENDNRAIRVSSEIFVKQAGLTR